MCDEVPASPPLPGVQLRKIKDLPRSLQRLRLTQGLLDSRDFQTMLERCCASLLRAAEASAALLEHSDSHTWLENAGSTVSAPGAAFDCPRSFQSLILLRDHLAALAAEHAEGERQTASLLASELLDTHSASFPPERGAPPNRDQRHEAVPAVVRRAAQCIGDEVLTCAGYVCLSHARSQRTRSARCT